MPVGYADPLKNEPTLDYSPPTLERVRYWSEFNDGNNNKNEKPSVNTNTNNNHLNEKSEILMLGMPMKNAIYSHNKHSTNQLTQTEAKSSNRRSSTYYPPEVLNALLVHIFYLYINNLPFISAITTFNTAANATKSGSI